MSWGVDPDASGTPIDGSFSHRGNYYWIVQGRGSGGLTGNY